MEMISAELVDLSSCVCISQSQVALGSSTSRFLYCLVWATRDVVVVVVVATISYVLVDVTVLVEELYPRYVEQKG